MASSVAFALKVGAGRITAAPVTIAVMLPSTQPKQWNSGTGMQMLSRSGELHVFTDEPRVVHQVEVSQHHAFGVPVVPEVYWMFAAFSGLSAGTKRRVREESSATPT